MKIAKYIIGSSLFLFLIGWLYNDYDERDLLRHGVLKIKAYPKSMKMLNYEIYGLSDFRAEYHISINPNEFDRLLVARNYKKQIIDKQNFRSIATGVERDTFPVKYCYTAGSEKVGLLVRVYSNEQHTQAFIIYDVW